MNAERARKVYARRTFPDGREAEVVPLLPGTARLVVYQPHPYSPYPDVIGAY
jgi:hypothetical protein